MNIDELTLGQIKQLQSIFPAGNTGYKVENWGWNICVLQRGFVIVGDVYKKGEWFTVKDCSCIRRWGTTRGLGELVSGPLSETKLDPQSDTRFHELISIQIMPVESDKWQK